MKNKVVILQSDDWEMLYVNGELVEENHTLNQGTERLTYFLEKAKEHDFDVEDIEFKYMNQKDIDNLEECGYAYKYLNEYQG